MALARECGLQQVNLGDTPKSHGFGGRQSPHPAAAGFFPSLLTPGLQSSVNIALC
jgi:hypothetical protein